MIYALIASIGLNCFFIHSIIKAGNRIYQKEKDKQ